MIDVKPLGLDGVLEISPQKFDDSRGFFSEIYSARSFERAGIPLVFVQDNHSFTTSAGVVRGLHYQLPPHAQDKLVRVIRGRIFDVAVDIRRGSPTFAKWIGIEVSAQKWNQMLVPAGFAHGFVTLEPNTEVIYKVTDYYSPEQDRSIRFDDPQIGIEWPVSITDAKLSNKDRTAPNLADAEIFDYRSERTH